MKSYITVGVLKIPNCPKLWNAEHRSDLKPYLGSVDVSSLLKYYRNW